ncbi:hypothetical protein SeMB42_g00935 [Synchytrium endobioticum]|uniref:Uncharacterized protein n=1 Tax=Synchytrium endobioticum TaxID=286115 RepID=A0A507DQF3_9FUNG|nr:hypothetical protein SeMB42_g00935 [Synchytrium endobioticum]
MDANIQAIGPHWCGLSAHASYAINKPIVDAAVLHAHRKIQHTTRPQAPVELDGPWILHHASADSPDSVTALDLTGQAFKSVSVDDMALFTSLRILMAGETVNLPFIAVTTFSALWQLHMPCCGFTSLTKSLEGKFELLEMIDLSYNHLKSSALTPLSQLSALRHLDLTCNDITKIPANIAQGFPKLQCLILDKNGVSSEHDLKTLGQLCCLEKLSLNDNKITSLSLFSQEAEANPDQKYLGFTSLTDLDIRSNRLASAEAIMSIAYLPALKYVQLENNPFMFKQTINVVVKSGATAIDPKQTEVLGYATFDLVKILGESYGITVGERPSVETDKMHVVADTGVDMWASNFCKTTVAPSKEESLFDREDLDDQELLDMANGVLASGKMPRLRDLRRILESRKRKRDSAQDQVPQNASQLKYEPSVQDPTFVTRIHIEEQLPHPLAHVSPQVDSESDSDTSSTESLDLRMPHGILASVRALRHALSHPNAYIRMTNMSYAKPTASWTHHVTAPTSKLARPVSASAVVVSLPPKSKAAQPAIIINTQAPGKRVLPISKKRDVSKAAEPSDEGCLQPASSMWQTSEIPAITRSKHKTPLSKIPSSKQTHRPANMWTKTRHGATDMQDMVEVMTRVDKKLRELALDISNTIGDADGE